MKVYFYYSLVLRRLVPFWFIDRFILPSPHTSMCSLLGRGWLMKFKHVAVQRLFKRQVLEQGRRVSSGKFCVIAGTSNRKWELLPAPPVAPDFNNIRT